MLRRFPSVTKQAVTVLKLLKKPQNRIPGRNLCASVMCGGSGSTPFEKSILLRRGQGNFVNQRRCFWGVDVAFNRVDEERVRLAGPDRAAAEWVLRNGGTIRWTTSSKDLADYNLLPSTQFDSYKLQELDLSSTDVIAIGFEHLKDLQHVTKIRMRNCKTCGDDGLSHFVHVSNTLTTVEISNCPMITEKGLDSFTKLKNLKHLVLYDLPDVRNFDTAIANLRSKIPQVDIRTTEPEQEKEEFVDIKDSS